MSKNGKENGVYVPLGYYSATKGGIMSLMAAWMNLESIILTYSRNRRINIPDPSSKIWLK